MKNLFISLFVLINISCFGQTNYPISNLPKDNGLSSDDSVLLVGLRKIGNAYTNRNFYAIDIIKTRLKISDTIPMLAPYPLRSWITSNYYSQTQADGRYAPINHTHSYSDIFGLSAVAHTGLYGDLIGLPVIPTIPANISAFANDVNYLTTTNANALYSLLGHKHPLTDFLASGATAGQIMEFDGTNWVPYTLTISPGFSPSGTSVQYIKGNGTYATFPTDLSSFANGPGYLLPAALTNYYTKTLSDARYLQSFTELDPSVSSTVKAISGLQVTHWDSVYTWYHLNPFANYITSSQIASNYYPLSTNPAGYLKSLPNIYIANDHTYDTLGTAPSDSVIRLKSISITGAGVTKVATDTTLLYTISTIQAALNVKDFGALGNGSTDDATAFRNAITAAISQNKRIYVPATANGYKIGSTLNITANGVEIFGDGDNRQSDGIGSHLFFYGTGPLFEIGTFDGLAENSNLYNGKQRFTLKNMHISAAAGTQIAINAESTPTYFQGTIAIRDNRGGDKTIDKVWFERFEWGVYDYESDFDRFSNCTFWYCKRGMYLGPRSDQGTFTSCDFYDCTTALEVKGATGLSFNLPTFVQCGSPTDPYVLLSSGNQAQNTGSINFLTPWFELNAGNLSSSSASTHESIMEIGTNETSTGIVGCVNLINPLFGALKIGSNNAAFTTNYFFKVDKVTAINVEGLDGVGWANLDSSYVKAVGTGSAIINMKGNAGALIYNTVSNQGTGTPKVVIQRYDGGNFYTFRDLKLNFGLGVSGLTPSTIATNFPSVVGIAAQPFTDNGFWVTGTDANKMNIYFGKLADPTQYRIESDRTNNKFNFIANGSNVGVLSANGIRLPAISQATRDAITSPAEGDIAINSSAHTVDYYASGVWNSLTTASTIASASKQIFSGSQLSNTGTTTENTVFTAVIPAGTLGINGSLDFSFFVDATNNTNAKTIKVKLAGTPIMTFGVPSNTTSTRVFGQMFNNGALNSQIFPSLNSTQGTVPSSGIAFGTSTVDFSAGVSITITITNAVSSDVVTIRNFKIVANN